MALTLALAFSLSPLAGCGGGGVGSGGEGSVDLAGAKDAAKSNPAINKAAASRGAKLGDASTKRGR